MNEERRMKNEERIMKEERREEREREEGWARNWEIAEDGWNKGENAVSSGMTKEALLQLSPLCSLF